jgi:PST family polysaccharide transporter
VLGPHFADAAPALRIFGLILPISTFGAVICFQWMLPIGFDKEFNVVVLLAGLLNVTLGIFFASRWSVTGMAAAVTIAELFAVLGFNVALLREGVSPFLHLKENPRLAKAPLPEPEWIS